MPDWRNVEDYAFTKNLTPEGWAWEFLRRNKNYRTDYRELCAFLSKLEDRFGSLEDGSVLRTIKKENTEGAYIFEPERNEGESLSAWQARCVLERVEPKSEFISVWRARQWGIKGRMPDPFAGYADPPRFIETPKWPKFVGLEECSEYFINEQSAPNYPFVLVGIDLSLSIKEQMRRLNDQVTSIKRDLARQGCIDTSSVKHRKGVWKTYLRILDAYDAGATANEIGKVLFHDEDVKARRNHVYDSRKKAIELRDSEYRSILLLALKT